MYLIYCLVLLLLVYLAPACALNPALLLSSRTAVAIPFVSIATVVVIQKALELTGRYSHELVLLVSLALLVIAVIRVFLLLRSLRPASGMDAGEQRFDWPATHRVLLVLSCLFGLYWAAQLGTSGFDTDDEIYSWNLWAVQHYLGHDIDFYYTQSPYPQLFPILISWCYKLLGSVELQLPVKAMFSLFPVAAWGAIAVAPTRTCVPQAIRSVVAMVLLTAAIGRYFSSGLADPLMCAALVVAVYAWIQYTRAPRQTQWLVLSLVCAGVAVYTKQAALIWALFSLPVIALVQIIRGRIRPAALVGVAALAGFGWAWITGAGSGFQDNHGVINASRQGRELFEQLWFAIQTHILGRPLVLLFLVAATVSVFTARRHRDLLLAFVLPALVVWLIYGAYSLRLGIHVAALSALLLAATDYSLPRWAGGGPLLAASTFARRYSIALGISLVVIITAMSLYRIDRNMEKIGQDFSAYSGGQAIIARYFGKDSAYVYTELYDRPDLLLWVPSNYIYGIFYGHTPLMRPASREKPGYNLNDLIDEIRTRQPDYLFESGPQVAYGPASALLAELAEKRCRHLFTRTAGPPNELGYTIYKLNKSRKRLDACADKLQASGAPGR